VTDEMYARALRADPLHLQALTNYALFLKNVRQDFDAAEVMFRRALDADPEDAISLGNYALFLKGVREDTDAAELMWQRAIETRRGDAVNFTSYAHFLWESRHDAHAADVMFAQSIAADPNSAYCLATYAEFQFERGFDQEAERLALSFLDTTAGVQDMDTLSLAVELHFFAAVALSGWRAMSLGRIRELLHAGIRSPESDFTRVLQRADAEHRSFLVALAGVIKDLQPMSGLNGFPNWPGVD
jgi:protein O-mannosyl-transferase